MSSVPKVLPPPSQATESVTWGYPKCRTFSYIPKVDTNRRCSYDVDGADARYIAVANGRAFYSLGNGRPRRTLPMGWQHDVHYKSLTTEDMAFTSGFTDRRLYADSLTDTQVEDSTMSRMATHATVVSSGSPVSLISSCTPARAVTPMDAEEMQYMDHISNGLGLKEDTHVFMFTEPPASDVAQDRPHPPSSADRWASPGEMPVSGDMNYFEDNRCREPPAMRGRTQIFDTGCYSCATPPQCPDDKAAREVPLPFELASSAIDPNDGPAPNALYHAPQSTVSSPTGPDVNCCFSVPGERKLSSLSFDGFASHKKQYDDAESCAPVMPFTPTVSPERRRQESSSPLAFTPDRRHTCHQRECSSDVYCDGSYDGPPLPQSRTHDIGLSQTLQGSFHTIAAHTHRSYSTAMSSHASTLHTPVRHTDNNLFNSPCASGGGGTRSQREGSPFSSHGVSPTLLCRSAGFAERGRHTVTKGPVVSVRTLSAPGMILKENMQVIQWGCLGLIVALDHAVYVWQDPEHIHTVYSSGMQVRVTAVASSPEVTPGSDNVYIVFGLSSGQIVVQVYTISDTPLSAPTPAPLRVLHLERREEPALGTYAQLCKTATLSGLGVSTITSLQVVGRMLYVGSMLGSLHICDLHHLRFDSCQPSSIVLGSTTSRTEVRCPSPSRAHYDPSSLQGGACPSSDQHTADLSPHASASSPGRGAAPVHRFMAGHIAAPEAARSSLAVSNKATGAAPSHTAPAPDGDSATFVTSPYQFHIDVGRPIFHIEVTSDQSHIAVGTVDGLVIYHSSQLDTTGSHSAVQQAVVVVQNSKRPIRAFSWLRQERCSEVWRTGPSGRGWGGWMAEHGPLVSTGADVDGHASLWAPAGASSSGSQKKNHLDLRMSALVYAGGENGTELSVYYLGTGQVIFRQEIQKPIHTVTCSRRSNEVVVSVQMDNDNHNALADYYVRVQQSPAANVGLNHSTAFNANAGASPSVSFSTHTPPEMIRTAYIPSDASVTLSLASTSSSSHAPNHFPRRVGARQRIPGVMNVLGHRAHAEMERTDDVTSGSSSLYQSYTPDTTRDWGSGSTSDGREGTRLDTLDYVFRGDHLARSVIGIMNITNTSGLSSRESDGGDLHSAATTTDAAMNTFTPQRRALSTRPSHLPSREAVDLPPFHTRHSAPTTPHTVMHAHFASRLWQQEEAGLRSYLFSPTRFSTLATPSATASSAGVSTRQELPTTILERQKAKEGPLFVFEVRSGATENQGVDVHLRQCGSCAGPFNSVVYAALSPDNKTFVTAGTEGLLRFWHPFKESQFPADANITQSGVPIYSAGSFVDHSPLFQNFALR